MMKVAALSPRTVSFHHHKPEPLVTRAPVRVASIQQPEEYQEARRFHLTPRELEVLTLLCEGLPNKLIGRRLDISSGTVKIHIGRILNELGVSSRLQAVVAAHRRGLVCGQNGFAEDEVRQHAPLSESAALTTRSYSRPLQAA